MAKKIRINYFRVTIDVPVIEGRRYGNVSVDEARNEAHKIVQSAKRHLSHEHDLGGIGIETDSDAICEHCDSRWTEDSPTYNGGCCDGDENNTPVTAETAT